MIPACKSLVISFFTTSRITRLSLLCGCLTGLAPSNKFIRCIHVDGPIPGMSARVQPIAFLCFLRTDNNFSSCASAREADLSQLFIGNKFASGAHSRIYRGIYKQRAVAVKMVRIPTQDEERRGLLEQQFKSEVALLSRLFHPNIVQVIKLLHPTQLNCESVYTYLLVPMVFVCFALWLFVSVSFGIEANHCLNCFDFKILLQT